MDESTQELNITELRLKKRPLWMSDLAIDDYADIVGGGGDIYKDRLPPAWPRHEGMELTDEEEKEVGPVQFDAESGKIGTQWQRPVTAEEHSQRVSGLSETVGEVVDTMKKTAETATETLAGVAGSLTALFKGKGKNGKKK